MITQTVDNSFMCNVEINMLKVILAKLYFNQKILAYGQIIIV